MFDYSVKELAKRQYVQDGWSVECIASHLRASPFTIKTWKEKGGWEVLRKEFVDASKSFTDEAFSFATQTMKSIRVDFVEKNIVDVSKLKLLDTLLARVDKVILLDIERTKSAKMKVENDNLPEGVLIIPKVQEALLVLDEELKKYNKRIENE